MNLFEAIMTRRSIRKYTEEEIPDDLLEQIMEAAMYAPSAVNKQPWEFLVFSDKKKMEAVNEFHPHAAFFGSASKGIVVCGDTLQAHTPEYIPLDCAAAIQNMLLAAKGLGIGSCWLGIYPRVERIEGVKKLFNLPQNIIPIAIISLGYSLEDKPTPDRFNSSKIHWNNW